MSTLWTQFVYDLPAFAGTMICLGLLILIGEGFHRWAGLTTRNTRRIVHAATGCFVAAFPVLFTYSTAVYVLAAVFILVNGIFLLGGFCPGVHPADRATWGTITFPLALLVVLPITWTPDRIFALQAAFLILAAADPMASWVGESMSGPGTLSGGHIRKTLRGGFAFVITAGAVLVFVALTLDHWPETLSAPGRLIALTVVGSITLGVVELLGGKGWDNFFIVIGAVVLLVIWSEHPGWTRRIVIASAVALGFGLGAWYLRYLTLSGALSGGLFAAALLGIGGWAWAVPGFTFFFLASVLSKIHGSHRVAEPALSDGEGRRTDRQVYANGGVGWILVIAYGLNPDPILYWAFLGAISAAATDTWASEVGPLFARRPRMITSGRPAPPGTSGAVSSVGTLAGFVGGTTIWAAALLTGATSIGFPGSVKALVGILVGGWMGSLLDSLVGATLQVRYKDSATGAWVERKEAVEGDPIGSRGWRSIDNERVNWIATAAGAVTTAGLVHLL